METSRFANFLRAFGATRLLLQRANGKGFLLEGLVLYAAIVDGYCRIGIILKDQIENQTNDFDEKLIAQGNDEKNYSERDVYGFALGRNIISQNLYDEINKLYDIRNKALHRFFLSEIEYTHLEIVCARYEKVYKEMWQIIYVLEEEQIKKGVGMTKQGDADSDAEKALIDLDIMRKIKTKDEKNLANTLGCTSVKEVIEFAHENHLFNKCTCGHEKSCHIDRKALAGGKIENMDQAFNECSKGKCSCKNFNEGENPI